MRRAMMVSLIRATFASSRPHTDNSLSVSAVPSPFAGKAKKSKKKAKKGKKGKAKKKSKKKTKAKKGKKGECNSAVARMRCWVRTWPSGLGSRAPVAVATRSSVL